MSARCPSWCTSDHAADAAFDDGITNHAGAPVAIGNDLAVRLERIDGATGPDGPPSFYVLLLEHGEAGTSKEVAEMRLEEAVTLGEMFAQLVGQVAHA